MQDAHKAGREGARIHPEAASPCFFRGRSRMHFTTVNAPRSTLRSQWSLIQLFFRPEVARGGVKDIQVEEDFDAGEPFAYVAADGAAEGDIVRGKGDGVDVVM